MDELRFDDRVAVITGAGRGLGRAYALLLASRGAKVVVNDLGGGMFGGGSGQPAADTVAEIAAVGGQAVANFADVSSEADAQALIAQAIDEYGRVDVVINNAGIVNFGAFPTLTRAELDGVLAVHVGGSFSVSRAAWPHFVEQGYGRIVMTSSSSVFGGPDQAHYAAAKGAIIGLTRSLSVEGREHAINVNAIMPVAATRMAAAWARHLEATLRGETGGRNGEEPVVPAELVAPAVAWLSHESCTATGEILAAAAGYVGRVFLAQTRGHVDADLSPESVRDAWEAICYETGYTVATSLEAIMPVMSQGMSTRAG